MKVFVKNITTSLVTAIVKTKYPGVLIRSELGTHFREKTANCI